MCSYYACKRDLGLVLSERPRVNTRLHFLPSFSIRAEGCAVFILIHAVCTAPAHSVQAACSRAWNMTPVPVHKGPAKPWEGKQATTEGCDVNMKYKVGVRLEDGVSAAKSVCCSCRGPEFSSIIHTRRLQSAITPAPEYLIPDTPCVYTHRYRHVNKNKVSIF